MSIDFEVSDLNNFAFTNKNYLSLETVTTKRDRGMNDHIFYKYK